VLRCFHIHHLFAGAEQYFDLPAILPSKSQLG